MYCTLLYVLCFRIGGVCSVERVSEEGRQQQAGAGNP